MIRNVSAGGFWFLAAMVLGLAASERARPGGLLPLSEGGGYWFWNTCDAGNQALWQQRLYCWDADVLLASLLLLGLGLTMAGCCFFAALSDLPRTQRSWCR
jgi:hypothetical protein